MFQMLAFGATDVGLERKNNEDALHSEAASGLFVVCDGMGGHASGELASKLAVESVLEFVTDTIHQDNFRWPFQSPNATTVESKVLDCAIRIANRKVYQHAQADSRHKGMGTTVVAMLAGKDKIGAVHVGDSRIYRLREGDLVQLTDDHSLLNHYKRTRPMSEDDIRNFKGKNVIVRAVGLRETVEPETHVWDYKSGDVYLLCTDGLTDLVDDDYIKTQLEQVDVGIKTATTNLIQRALAAGGKDNVTVMILTVEHTAGIDAPTEELESVPHDEQVGLEDTSPGFSAAGENGSWDQETMPGLAGMGIESIEPSAPPDLDSILNAPTEVDNRHLRVTPDTVQVKVRGSASSPLKTLDDDTPDETPAMVPERRAKSEESSRTLVDKQPPKTPLGRTPAQVRIRHSSAQMSDTEPYGLPVVGSAVNEDTDRFDAVNVIEAVNVIGAVKLIDSVNPIDSVNEETPDGVPVVPTPDTKPGDDV